MPYYFALAGSLITSASPIQILPGIVSGPVLEAITLLILEPGIACVRHRAANIGPMENVMQDLRFAWRALRKNRGFALAVIGTLALGIGAATAMFSVVNAVFLRPLPYREPKNLVWATEFYPKFNRSLMLAPEYLAWKSQNSSFERLEAFGVSIGVNFAGGRHPAQRIQAGHVTPGFFSMLGVQPRLGRSFLAEESRPGHDRVTILSDGVWRDYFGADLHIIGKEVLVNGVPHTVIGVMPGGFLSPDGADTGVWLPDAVKPEDSVPRRAAHLVSTIGRLKPGVRVEQTRADLGVIARRMDKRYPTPWSGYHARATARIVPLRGQFTADFRIAPSVLMGAAGIVLLIVCANIANLSLARAVTREKEIAIRAAIGGSRLRLVRLLTTESLVLAAAGGAAGVALSVLVTSRLGFLIPKALPKYIPADWRVLAFAVLCALATTLIFGLLPALSTSRPNLNVRLKEGEHLASSPRQFNIRSTLAVCQLALSLVLLIAAGLLIRSFLLLMNANPGFDSKHVLLADVSLAPLEMYTPARQADFFDRLLDFARKLPSVQYAAISSSTPLVPFNEIGSGLRGEGEPESDATVCFTSVSGDYFKALRIQLREGRFFDLRDRDSAPRVAILNRTLARVLFGDRDPVGKRVKIGNTPSDWVTVVGVVADIRHRALDDKVWPELFQPYTQAPSPWMSVVVRSFANPSNIAPSLIAAVQSIDRTQPAFDVESMEQRVSGSTAQRRFRAWLFGAFAFVALAIAVVGLYGVMAYAVARRTHEIGVRLAIGAKRRDILRMVAGQALRLALAGIGIGLAAAYALTHTLSTFLYGVTPTDGVTFAVVSAILAVTALFASAIPAHRATKVDPMAALRHE